MPMKYKRVYEILRKRKQKVSGFSYDDRSCWDKEDYTARLTPLWICAEDKSIGYRLWITQTSASAAYRAADQLSDGSATAIMWWGTPSCSSAVGAAVPMAMPR